MVGLYAAPTTVYIVFKSVSYKAASLALRGYSFDALLCSIMDVNLFIRLCPFFLQNFLYLENKWKRRNGLLQVRVIFSLFLMQRFFFMPTHSLLYCIHQSGNWNKVKNMISQTILWIWRITIIAIAKKTFLRSSCFCIILGEEAAWSLCIEPLDSWLRPSHRFTFWASTTESLAASFRQESHNCFPGNACFEQAQQVASSADFSEEEIILLLYGLLTFLTLGRSEMFWIGSAWLPQATTGDNEADCALAACLLFLGSLAVTRSPTDQLLLRGGRFSIIPHQSFHSVAKNRGEHSFK